MCILVQATRVSGLDLLTPTAVKISNVKLPESRLRVGGDVSERDWQIHKIEAQRSDTYTRGALYMLSNPAPITSSVPPNGFANNKSDTTSALTPAY